jgi:uncharacterized repeat protein (TIGR03803 family)
VFDSAGNLYGTTENDGAFGDGTVFQVSPGGNGQWTLSNIYDFAGASDGALPAAGLVIDAAGNLYGTTGAGGLTYGVVFELSPSSGGQWNESVLYTFTKTDGRWPSDDLALDAAGNLYGTGYSGGSSQMCLYGCGTVFELTPNGGTWTQTILHNFNDGTDGSYPTAGLVLDSAGNLYGTTTEGGSGNQGVVFEIKLH